MSRFSATVIIDAGEATRSIFESIDADNRFYPESQTVTKISYDGKVKVVIASEHVQHLRANLNYTLRLVQASHDSIESLKI